MNAKLSTVFEHVKDLIEENMLQYIPATAGLDSHSVQMNVKELFLLAVSMLVAAYAVSESAEDDPCVFWIYGELLREEGYDLHDALHAGSRIGTMWPLAGGLSRALLLAGVKDELPRVEKQDRPHVLPGFGSGKKNAPYTA